MLSKKFLTEYQKLNAKQKEAVDAIEGPVMVIAGPGTGKTQILAMRIANILAKTQINPSNILALTFTNSAVATMKKRLLDIIGPPAYQVQVYTFHAFCNEVIVQYPEKFLTAKKINQLDELEQIELIQNILKKHSFKLIKPLKAPYHYQSAIIKAISKLKQEDISPKFFKDIILKEEATLLAQSDLAKGKMIEKQNRIAKNKELAVAYHLYQKALVDSGKYDYNDMILFVLNAFKTDEELLIAYQERFQYILVDEFQDTNTSQNEIIKILSSFYDVPNVFVVGDDEQSIFRFQGASMENILTFKKDYPQNKIVILENNYRSGQKILDASRSLISQNKNQIFNILKISKNLKSQIKTVSKINVAEFSTGSIESYFIGKEIQKLIASKISPSEIAVIFREKRDSEELVEYLGKMNIPYHLEVGDNILDDPQIKKLITYFKALNAKKGYEQNQPLLEVMHLPFFKLSPVDIYKVCALSGKDGQNMFDVLTDDLKKLKLKDKKSVENFVEIFIQSMQIVHVGTFTVAFEQIVDQAGFLEYLLSLKDISHLNRLQTLFKYIQNLNVHHKDLNLDKFLKHLKLLEENDLKIKEDVMSAEYSGVNLLTAHKSKGLEFEYVFIIHLTDKHWGNKTQRDLIKLPGLQKIQKTTDDLEEERRLFYVSLTRAKKEVYLSYAQNYGDTENTAVNMPSIFLSEIPSKYLTKIESKVYEKNFDERLKLKFSAKKWEHSKTYQDFIKGILDEFQLSPTALNGYLECPQRFFYDNILRVPKAKDFTQMYGTAVHFAIEGFFKLYQRDLKLPPKNILLEYFKEGLEHEILEKSDYRRALEQGTDVLKNYYDFYKAQWQAKGIPVSCEYNFRTHDVHFGEIPITGILDKIEMIDKTGGVVRIIDYKTSSPKSLNFLLGLTKEKDTKLLYQAYFYKLLCETDPLFKWKVGEIAFDFITPEKGKFKQVTLPLDQKEYETFKDLVKKMYGDILKLDFSPNHKNCINKSFSNTKCDYLNLCQ